MAAPVINTPALLEHRIKTPDGRTLAIAEWGDPDGLPVIAMHVTPWRSHDVLRRPHHLRASRTAQTHLRPARQRRVRAAQGAPAR